MGLAKDSGERLEFVFFRFFFFQGCDSLIELLVPSHGSI